MDADHKRLLMTHLKRLIEETDWELVMERIKDKNIFPPDSIEAIENQETARDRKRELYLEVQKRGPHAFTKLVTALVESGHFELASLLQPNVVIREYFPFGGLEEPDARGRSAEIASSGTVPLSLINDCASLQISPGPVNDSTEPLTVKVTNSIQYLGNPQDSYPMYSRPRGYALILNNVTFENDIHEVRTGAEVDGRNMKDLWEQMGYECIYKENRGYADFRNDIRNFAQKPEHAHANGAVVAIMSHGLKDGIIAYDGRTVSVEWIIEQFDNNRSENLRDKPKLFFIQACRGDTVDAGTKYVSTERRTSADSGVRGSSASSLLVHKPSQSDMYIVYSTISGYVSMRDFYRGSWFVEAICSVFMTKAHTCHLEKLLREVQQQVQLQTDQDGAKQTVECVARGFVKKLYFNPGLFGS